MEAIGYSREGEVIETPVETCNAMVAGCTWFCLCSYTLLVYVQWGRRKFTSVSLLYVGTPKTEDLRRCDDVAIFFQGETSDACGFFFFLFLHSRSRALYHTIILTQRAEASKDEHNENVLSNTLVTR